MNVLVGYAGQKSLGHAGPVRRRRLRRGAADHPAGMNPWLALVLAAAISAAVFGVLIALPSLRVKGPYLAMVTLAFGIVVEKLVGGMDRVFGGQHGIYGIAPLTWNGGSSRQCSGHGSASSCAPPPTCCCATCCWAASGAPAVAAGGRDRRRHRWGFESTVPRSWLSWSPPSPAAIAGALVAQQNQYINSDFITFHLSIFILLLVLFGGAGSMYGPLVGAVLLTLLDALLRAMAVGAALPLRLPVAVRAVCHAGRRRRDCSATWFKRRQAGRQRSQMRGDAVTNGLRPAAAEGELSDGAGCHKAYGGVKPAQKVSFRLQRGHIHALIGPNGAGKSTMINMLTGVVDPDAGSIPFAGRTSRGSTFHAICSLGMARTFQNLQLFAELSVLDNVLARPAQPHEERLPGRRCSRLPAARHEEEQRARARAQLLRARRPCIDRAEHGGRQPAVRTAAAAGDWPAHWPPSRSCCCSTNRPPA